MRSRVRESNLLIVVSMLYYDKHTESCCPFFRIQFVPFDTQKWKRKNCIKLHYLRLTIWFSLVSSFALPSTQVKTDLVSWNVSNWLIIITHTHVYTVQLHFSLIDWLAILLCLLFYFRSVVFFFVRLWFIWCPRLLLISFINNIQLLFVIKSNKIHTQTHDFSLKWSEEKTKLLKMYFDNRFNSFLSISFPLTFCTLFISLFSFLHVAFSHSHFINLWIRCNNSHAT